MKGILKNRKEGGTERMKEKTTVKGGSSSPVSHGLGVATEDLTHT